MTQMLQVALSQAMPSSACMPLAVGLSVTCRDEKAKPWVPPGASRHLDIWRKPEEFLPGWRRAYCIVIPGPELRVWSEPSIRNAAEGVTWLALPSVDHAVYLEILAVDVGTSSVVEVDDAIDVAALKFSSGAGLEVIARIAVQRWPARRRDRPPGLARPPFRVW
jgi:hypothetical protein